MARGADQSAAHRPKMPSIVLKINTLHPPAHRSHKGQQHDTIRTRPATIPNFRFRPAADQRGQRRVAYRPACKRGTRACLISSARAPSSRLSYHPSASAPSPGDSGKTRNPPPWPTSSADRRPWSAAPDAPRNPTPLPRHHRLRCFASPVHHAGKLPASGFSRCPTVPPSRPP